MDIFERLIPNEFAVRDFSFDLAQSTCDHLELVSRENSGGSESRSVGDGPSDSVLIKPPIERHRFALALRDLGCRRGKSFGSHDDIIGSSFPNCGYRNVLGVG
jgi:hypothetical protein